MSDFEHIVCMECESRIFPDPNNEVKRDLESRFNGHELLCPTCIEKSYATIDALTHNNRMLTNELGALTTSFNFLRTELNSRNKKIETLLNIVEADDRAKLLLQQSQRIEVLEKTLSDYWWKSSPGNFS